MFLVHVTVIGIDLITCDKRLVMGLSPRALKVFVILRLVRQVGSRINYSPTFGIQDLLAHLLKFLVFLLVCIFGSMAIWEGLLLGEDGVRDVRQVVGKVLRESAYAVLRMACNMWLLADDLLGKGVFIV